MDETREQLLTGAALAENQHRRRELRHLLHEIEDAARALAGSDHELAIVLLGNLFAQADDVAIEILPLAGVGDEPRQAFEVDVLRDVVIRAEPHRFDRDIELAHLRSGDHFDVGVVLFRDLEHLEAGDAGKVRVEDHQIDVLLLHHLQRRFAGRCAQHAEVAPQQTGERFAHPLVVVDDQQGLPSV